MAFDANISALAARLKSDIMVVHQAINGDVPTAGNDVSTIDVSALVTTATNLVGAINEIAGTAGAAAVINDAATNATEAWSSTKIAAEINAAVTNLIDGAPGALDTLNEIAAAINDDASYAATLTSQLALKANSADVYTQAQLGDPTTDYVAIYDAA